MDFANEIGTLIKNNLATYNQNPDRFIADYNHEVELTKEYNGRQLLELLQNADDAASGEVLIKWDKENSKLTISNKGNPFEVGGIKSLMIANLSTKTKNNYIGNKGLGFRSILNWAKEINIKRSDCTISFSEKIAHNAYKTKLESEKAKAQLEINKEKYANTIPFPILAIPEVSENKTSDSWVTSIELIYRKEFEEDIKIQLDEIREEILLFLNNIKKITIEKDAECVKLISSKSKYDQFELVTIQDKKWKVFSKENVLPNEYRDSAEKEEKYNLKVAFQEDLSDNFHKLFNYFPTQVSILLPCIIHGTFELDSSRNHLVNSRKNEYIIKELVQLIKHCALYLTKQNVDWNAYELINSSTNTSDSKLIETLYKDLAGLKQTERIYPCINKEYYSQKDAKYYSDEFNAFFQKNYPKVLPQLLMPIQGEVSNCIKGNIFDHSYLVKIIDELSTNGIDLELRAELITQLAKICTPNSRDHFSLLINEQGDVIPKDKVAFTPIVRSDKEFSIPKSVKMDFMKSELYDLLSNMLENGFDKKEKPVRELQRCIKTVVNLQPYDSSNVTEKIITGTKEILTNLKTDKEKQDCIKDMVTTLYANFNNTDNKLDKLKLTIPLISKSNTIINAEDLFLSETYENGKIIEIIYQGMLNNDDYLAPLDYWGLDDDLDSISIFFIWLGVNQFSKIKKIDLKKNREEGKEYIDFIFKNGTQVPDYFSTDKIQSDSISSKIELFDKIVELPQNQILLLVLKDDFIRKLLEINNEKIFWSYNVRREISSKYSYIQFQFYRSSLFTKYILEEGSENQNRLINGYFQIDYKYFEQFGIPKTEVRYILTKLGAKETFNDILPEDVYEILKAIPKKDIEENGKGTANIYKLALENLIKHNSNTAIPDDMCYFSRTSDKYEYKHRKDIYYTDNSTLPKKILNTLPILNLQKRIGENNVEKYLGVKNLKGLEPKIVDDKLRYNNQCDKVFNSYFESIKPFILVYRLESPTLRKNISSYDAKRSEAKLLKNCSIRIVTECHYIFEDEENFIDKQEFINDKNIFYFKESDITDVDSLKKDSFFCDAFAEMMCITFKINDLKNEFRQIFKNDISDTKHLIHQDIGNDKLNEGYQLLGLSKAEIDFWGKIFKLKEKQFIEFIETNEILKQEIYKQLGIELSADYCEVDFENFENQAAYNLITLLSSKLSLKPEDILPKTKDLYKYHKNKLKNILNNFEYNFKQCLWLDLSSKHSKQENFISKLHEYNYNFMNGLDSVINRDLDKYNLDMPYDTIIKDGIKKNFGIEINEEQTDYCINNLYTNLLEEYKIEENDLPVNICSLLYFEDNSEKIKIYLKEQIASENKVVSSDNSLTSIGTLVNISLSKNKIRPQNELHNGNKSGVHSSQRDKNKKQKGKNAENLVYNTLVDKYGEKNVKWVSGNSTTPDKDDNKHYDIKYKMGDSLEWKLVEVKAISDNQFIITSAEIDKGLNNAGIYEIALVKGEQIFLVEDIFKFKEGETFSNNSKFTATPKDYILSFDTDF